MTDTETPASSDAFKAPFSKQESDQPSDCISSKETETPTPFDAFKAPFLKQESDQPSESISSKEKITEKTEKDIKTRKRSDKPQIIVPLPYKEPEWGGNPPYSYSFEIIKNGTLISTFKISSSLLTFGRLEVCDFVFEHPSVSRYHAIVQYCKGDDTHPKGFYLYDLGSTHGTFLNKSAVKPKIYYKLKVGYILKFGGSSRLHIFQGPEEEEEVEAKKPEEKNEDVCSWGMGEDAVEDEDSEINPFALSTANEELYLDDPKKTLRGWFEREGYEVEYNVEEKGHQTFMCTIQLPIDTLSGEFMPVQTTVSGKKKEAVVACALEACRTLDRLGLLRQSHHESRQRKKKKWEENDYYDSDEDTFYDRTGEIEKRREMRKRLAKKTEAENFESLQAKLKGLVEEVKGIEVKLEACAAQDALSLKDGDEDSLEMYMSNLSKAVNAPTDKFEKRKLKLRLMEAQKEQLQLEKMLNIARPTKLPPVAKHPGIIGKRLKSKLQLPVVKVVENVEEQDTNEEEIEEDESDSEAPVAEKKSKQAEEEKDEIVEVKVKNNELKEINDEKRDNLVGVKGKKYGLQLNIDDEPKPEESKKIVLDESTEESAQDTISCPSVSMQDTVEEPDEQMDIEETAPKRTKRQRHRKDKKLVDVYKTDTAEYCTWTPPTGQSGDGMTHLNAKFGY
ncbi:hypothetical protein JTE90_021040 [Oedothorax gibbosus]|uniref:FHA domain-containing protein n=1 Tax=Oedothorax gibbosus TaxID=931172 RepID=A0AAV6VSG0_9ARAC|nr:hypothetical protein JTE90_021040 [Oedothorax gibbosus]